MAVGGHGMYVNCCDNGPKMPEFYQLTTQNSRPAKPFDFQHAGITPDAVVINLGVLHTHAGALSSSHQSCRRCFVVASHDVVLCLNMGVVAQVTTTTPAAGNFLLSRTNAAHRFTPQSRCLGITT